MDIVLKEVSVDCLFSLKMCLETMIHDIQLKIYNLEKQYLSSTGSSKDCYEDVLKNKHQILFELRHIYNQL